MPLPLTTAPAPVAPTGPAKYTPHRMSPSMASSTAPIAGEAAPPVVAEAEPAAAAGEQAESASQDSGGDTGQRLAIVARADERVRVRRDAVKAEEIQLKGLREELARREAALKADEEKRAAVLEAREQALQAEEEKRRVWRQNPAQLLRDHGYSVEAALQHSLNGEKLTPEQKLAADLDQRLADERKTTSRETQRLREEMEQREADRQAEAQRLQAEQERLEAERQAEEARTEQQSVAQYEQEAVRELHADIGEIVAGDKDLVLVRQSGQRGVTAVYERVNAISDEQHKKTGRRPPITTKLLERAAAEIEEAARKELRESLADPEIAKAVGVGRPAAPAQRTLTNQATPVQTPAAATAQETAAQKTARVRAQIDGILKRKMGL